MSNVLNRVRIDFASCLIFNVFIVIMEILADILRTGPSVCGNSGALSRDRQVHSTPFLAFCK